VGDLHSTLTDPIFGSAVTLDGSLAQPGFSNEMPSGKKSTCLLFTIKNPLAPTLFEERGSYTWKLVYENASGRWEQILSPSAFDGNTLFYFESCLGSPSFFPEKGSKYFVNLELWQGDALKYFAGGTIYGYRSGKPTARYITKVLNRVTLMGAIFLSIIAVVPLIANIVVGLVSPENAANGQLVSLAFGGSSLLIVVGVVLETARELEAQMAARNMKGKGIWG
jgi:hypothetical protein